MLGKTHAVLAGLFYVPLAYAFASQGHVDAYSAIAFLFGVFLGVLLPDADVGDSKIMHAQPGLAGAYKRLYSSSVGAAFPLAGYVTRYLFYVPLSALLRFTPYKDAAKHRGVLHSLVGVLLVGVLWAVLLNAASFASGGLLPGVFANALAAGIACGALLHLYHDSLTPGGINWLFPARKAHFCGRIKGVSHGLWGRTGFFDSSLYAVLLFCVLAAAVSWLALVAGTSAFFLSGLSVFGLMLVALACGMKVPESRGLLELDNT